MTEENDHIFNEMVDDYEDVVNLGKEMEQISEHNESDPDNDWTEDEEETQK